MYIYILSLSFSSFFSLFFPISMSLGGVTAYVLGGMSATVSVFGGLFASSWRLSAFVHLLPEHLSSLAASCTNGFNAGHTHAKTGTITGIHGAITQFIVTRWVER